VNSGVRRRRRPRRRWLQDVKDDMRRMRTGKWKEYRNENTWQLIVKEAKAHQRLYSRQRRIDEKKTTRNWKGNYGRTV
jgi:hypothetical protein